MKTTLPKKNMLQKELSAALICVGFCVGVPGSLRAAKPELQARRVASVGYHRLQRGNTSTSPSKMVVGAKAPDVPAWKRLLQQGYRLSNQLSSTQRRRGIRLLHMAHSLAPKTMETLVGAARAHMLLGFANKRKMAYHGEKGLVLARRMIQKYPRRAEGYLWSAIHTGLVAQGISPMSAFFRGLPKQIEAMAKASIRRNPRLYNGVAQRLLGRFYYMLPWPMKRTKLSRHHLAAAYRLAPSQSHGLLFYGETLLAVGQRSMAKRLFRRCAKAPLLQPFTNPAQAPVNQIIAQCRKHLR